MESWKADLVVVNANVITMNEKRERAEAFAVKDGRFIAVGTSSEIEELIGKNTKVLDLEGKTVVPGFIDAHCHPSLVAKERLKADLGPTRVQSIEDVIRVLKDVAQRTPSGEWILGTYYDDTKVKEKRMPTKEELDKASKEHPIVISHVSLHLGSVNSKALEIAGITKDTPDPEGGEFERDANGELTGVVKENAFFNYFTIGTSECPPVIPPLGRTKVVESLSKVLETLASRGITSVGDGLIIPEDIRAYQDLYWSGKLPIRVTMYIHGNYLDLLTRLMIRTGFGNEWIKIGGIKFFVDGAIAGRTAYLSQPYEGTKEYYGIVTITQEKLNELVLKSHKAELQIHTHANGDKAIEMILDAYEKALEEYPREDHRHTIVHCTVVTQEILGRIKKLGCTVLPFTTYVYAHGEKMSAYGSRISMMFAFRSFLEYGIPVGAGSDYPCGPFDPLLAIQTMVTRKSTQGEVLGPEQRISVEEALWIYTMGGAYALFEENVKGSIEVGKLADFVVLSEDPTKVLPDSIKDIEVEKTFVGGKRVYEKTK
ncbi:MAG: amidohydrolase [Candidatus Heimdallarchaeaceae archaeon]